MNTTAPHKLLPLTPTVFHILLALADGEKHGYSIMREVKTISAGQVTMGPGTLYGSIKRMLENNLIEESDERPDPAMDNERRRYYHLSDFGVRILEAEAARLNQLVNAIRAKRLMGDA